MKVVTIADQDGVYKVICCVDEIQTAEERNKALCNAIVALRPDLCKTYCRKTKLTHVKEDGLYEVLTSKDLLTDFNNFLADTPGVRITKEKFWLRTMQGFVEIAVWDGKKEG